MLSLPPITLRLRGWKLIDRVTFGSLLLLSWGLRIGRLLSPPSWRDSGSSQRAYILHMDINCGCSSTPEPLTLKTVIRDGLLVAFAILMTIFVYIEARQPHPRSAPEKGGSPLHN